MYRQKINTKLFVPYVSIFVSLQKIGFMPTGCPQVISLKVEAYFSAFKASQTLCSDARMGFTAVHFV